MAVLERINCPYCGREIVGGRAQVWLGLSVVQYLYYYCLIYHEEKGFNDDFHAAGRNS